MNLIILICIVVSQLFFQAVYFEKYYLSEKENDLKIELNKFSNLLNYESDKVEIMEYIRKVNAETGINLSFRSKDYTENISMNDYMQAENIIVNDDISGKEYKIVVGDQFKNVNVEKGDKVEVDGFTDGYGYMFPSKIFVNNIEVKPIYDIVPSDTNVAVGIAKPAYSTDSEDSEIKISGIISNIKYESKSYFINIDLYLNEDDNNSLLTNKNYEAKLKSISGDNEILINSKAVNNGSIVAFSSLSQVNDIMGIMNGFYFIIFFIVLILVVIISIVYSKFMIRPLVDMSKVAKRISECDFKHNYEVNSEDEIGILGNSLNLISDNLECALNELKSSNIKLKEDINIQSIQEEKRKELVANISHELKTPITIIQGVIGGIKNGIYTTEMYDDILEETVKMNDLVKEMLEISKLESPAFKLKKEPFDLCRVILKENDKLKSIINEKYLNINIDIDDEAIAIGDEKRINQVITNLFTNAIKYTPSGENIHVKVELKGNKYKFSIENFGVTLEDEDLKNIWNSFYRGEKSRNKKYGGTGLGLFIVKIILELHGSNFGVESGNNSVVFFFDLECYENNLSN
ncbi:HAMP domain-containing histidine kinase [Clostridium gasigenes]|uniref:sensor histidine kinase n=1 Tax=Clostridium gasigenes TaxID=94869 RepID=UPI001C0DAFF3|nr:HAMP domain-containing sensor histidine kinase [Clostridium gasigenes]MBU3137775.1 HAMP domain-containing histidine kinase [Clostridium gasigenes]